jgi:ribosomal protein S18 acetylase RimI-like enzyme
VTDDELYRRGMETLVASWQSFATAAPSAALVRTAGVAAAVFPDEPERSIYNNALLDRSLTSIAARVAAIDAMEDAYVTAGVVRFAAWVHETDASTRAELERRGYAVQESTLAMGTPLADAHLDAAAVGVDVVPFDWPSFVRLFSLPADLLRAWDDDRFRLVAARVDGETVSSAMAFDLDGDCGIFNVGTLERARRRGLGTALTAEALRGAIVRGCETATLQSTPVAERVYAAVGFRSLGRILEYVPERLR